MMLDKETIDILIDIVEKESLSKEYDSDQLGSIIVKLKDYKNTLN